MKRRTPLPRVPAKEQEILALLGTSERYGLELVELSEGAIKRGSIYVLLGRLEERGLVSSRAEGRDERATGLPRRLYKTTALGRAVLAAQAAALGVLLKRGMLP